MPAGPHQPVPDLIRRQHAEQLFRSAVTQTFHNIPDDPYRRILLVNPCGAKPGCEEK